MGSLSSGLQWLLERLSGGSAAVLSIFLLDGSARMSPERLWMVYKRFSVQRWELNQIRTKKPPERLCGLFGGVYVIRRTSGRLLCPLQVLHGVLCALLGSMPANTMLDCVAYL